MFEKFLIIAILLNYMISGLEIEILKNQKKIRKIGLKKKNFRNSKS